MKKRTRYILVFVLTVIIFLATWYASFLINKRRFNNLQMAQDQASIDILTSETQFDLNKNQKCDQGEVDTFSSNLAKIADKISYAEQNNSLGQDILDFKKQYSLLEVRDYLLNKRISEHCNYPLNTIFYFYGTKVDCPDCVKEGYVLDAVRQEYPEVRIYAFDHSLDLATLKALKQIYNIGDGLPALVVDGQTYNNFVSLEQISKIISANQK